MAEEIALESAYGSIDPGELVVYPLPPEQTVDGANQVQFIDCGEWPMFSPIDGDEVFRKVEIEYRPDEVGLSEWSVCDYLASFREAAITDEAFGRVVVGHLRDALETNDVLVQTQTVAEGGMSVEGKKTFTGRT